MTLTVIGLVRLVGQKHQVYLEKGRRKEERHFQYNLTDLTAGVTFPLLRLELVHGGRGGDDEARHHLHCRVCPGLDITTIS